MAIQTFDQNTGRINKFKGKILKHAVPAEILSRAGRQEPMPKNNSKTYVARRWLPYGGASTNSSTINRFYQDGNSADRSTAIANQHLTTEGVTSTPDSLTPVDTTVVVQQYNCLYGFTDVVFNMYEDDVPTEMEKQIGERVTFVNEQICYGGLKACTNQYYGGTGTTVATVNGGISLGLIRKIVMNLQANHAMMVTSILKADNKFGTSPVNAGYLVYGHTDLEPDISDLPGFKSVETYASGTALPYEIGACGRFRFILSPDLPSVQNGGAAIGATNLYSTSGTSLDVYPLIVVAQDAWSQIAVRGVGSLNPTFLPVGQKDKSDPHGQRGYAGTIWWKAILIENPGWMAVVNVGRKNLPV